MFVRFPSAECEDRIHAIRIFQDSDHAEGEIICLFPIIDNLVLAIGQIALISFVHVGPDLLMHVQIRGRPCF